MTFYQVFHRDPYTDDLRPIGKLTRHRKSARNTVSKRRHDGTPGEQLEIHALRCNASDVSGAWVVMGARHG